MMAGRYYEMPERPSRKVAEGLCWCIHDALSAAPRCSLATSAGLAALIEQLISALATQMALVLSAASLHPIGAN